MYIVSPELAHLTRKRRSRGFTLLEILVVMTLLSVVMIALTSALRTIAKTEARIDSRVARADDFRVAVSFLRSVLGRISAKKITAPAQPDALPFLFSAEPNAMAWVGIMPARYGAGGRTFFRLAVEDMVAGKALVIRFLPWIESTSLPDWSQAESRVLVPNVSSFTVQYEDARANPPTWAEAWTQKNYLPQHVKLNIQTASGAWPDFVMPLRSLPASNPGAGGFVIGGGG